MKLIKTESGFIAVSDETPNTNDIVITKNNNRFHQYMELIGLEHNKNNCFKVIASTFNPELFPDIFYEKLPELKFSLEVADILGVWDAEEEYRKQIEFEKYIDTPSLSAGFIVGFEKHKDLSKRFEFTEDDMIKAIMFGRKLEKPIFKPEETHILFEMDKYIKSIRTKEYEVESFEKSEDTLTILKIKL